MQTWIRPLAVALCWLSPTGAAHATTPLEVEAERLDYADGEWTAEGATVRIDGATLTADRMWIDASGALTAERGTWTGPEAAASFERAELSPDRRHVVLRGAILRPCACDGPEPWGLRAGEIEIVPGAARVRQAHLVVLGTPILPLPRARIPTARRSGLLLPSLQSGQDGLVVAQPVYLTAGRSADLTLTPELRTQRGGRLIGEARYAGRSTEGQAVAHAAYEPATSRPRGAVRWQHAHARGSQRAVAELAAVSDPTFWSDYQPDRLDRLLPFTTSRALLGGRNLEVSALGAARSSREALGIAQIGAMKPWTPLPGGLLARAAVTATGMARIEGGEVALNGLGTAELDLERPTWLGPFRVTPGARLGLLAEPGEHIQLRPEASPHIDLTLPLWRSDDRGLTRLEPHLSARAQLGRPGIRYATHSPTPAGLAAGLRARRTLAGGGLIEAVVQGAWDGERPTPHAELRIDRGVTALQAAWRPGGNDPLTWLRGAIDPGPVAVRARLVHRTATLGDLTLAGGSLIARPGPFELGAGVDTDLEARAWLSRHAWLSWTHRSGCLSLGISARIDEDRAAPDLALQIGGQPGLLNASRR